MERRAELLRGSPWDKYVVITVIITSIAILAQAVLDEATLLWSPNHFGSNHFGSSRFVFCLLALSDFGSNHFGSSRFLFRHFCSSKFDLESEPFWLMCLQVYTCSPNTAEYTHMGTTANTFKDIVYAGRLHKTHKGQNCEQNSPPMSRT